MVEPIKMAIQTFAQNHNNLFPTNFIIYRDGVGDAMRHQVLASEVSQFESAIKQLYKNEMEQPEITVVVVNKRITQRIFVKDQRSGKLVNPPSGCILDKVIVDNYDNESQFDFFMVPATTT